MEKRGRKKFFVKHDQTVRNLLETSPLYAFTETDLIDLLNSEDKPFGELSGGYWRYKERFINHLLETNLLIKLEFKSPETLNTRTIYSRSKRLSFALVQSLRSNAYYSHYSAMAIHGLTLQLPKTYYLNSERPTHYPSNSKLNQEAIDNAFSKPQRQASPAYSYNGKTIFLLSGQFTNKLGVISPKGKYSFSYTDLERTLIDITIRPVYSGGVFEVLDAYIAAKEKLNIVKLYQYLNSLAYVYPYHQAVGFFLERAGYPPSEFNIFKSNFEFSFYLTYGIKRKSFNETWRIYYPTGM